MPNARNTQLTKKTLIAAEDSPTRKANISLRILMNYTSDYMNLTSEESKKLITILSREVCIFVSLSKFGKLDILFYNWF